MALETREGVPRDQALARIWLRDSKGRNDVIVPQRPAIFKISGSMANKLSLERRNLERLRLKNASDMLGFKGTIQRDWTGVEQNIIWQVLL
jgi:hypothetical protein